MFRFLHVFLCSFSYVSTEDPSLMPQRRGYHRRPRNAAYNNGSTLTTIDDIPMTVIRNSQQQQLQNNHYQSGNSSGAFHL